MRWDLFARERQLRRRRRGEEQQARLGRFEFRGLLCCFGHGLASEGHFCRYGEHGERRLSLGLFFGFVLVILGIVCLLLWLLFRGLSLTLNLFLLLLDLLWLRFIFRFLSYCLDLGKRERLELEGDVGNFWSLLHLLCLHELLEFEGTGPKLEARRRSLLDRLLERLGRLPSLGADGARRINQVEVLLVAEALALIVVQLVERHAFLQVLREAFRVLGEDHIFLDYIPRLELSFLLKCHLLLDR